MRRLWNGLKDHPGVVTALLCTILFLISSNGIPGAGILAVLMSLGIWTIVLVTAYQIGEE